MRIVLDVWNQRAQPVRHWDHVSIQCRYVLAPRRIFHVSVRGVSQAQIDCAAAYAVCCDRYLPLRFAVFLIFLVYSHWAVGHRYFLAVSTHVGVSTNAWPSDRPIHLLLGSLV